MIRSKTEEVPVRSNDYKTLLGYCRCTRGRPFYTIVIGNVFLFVYYSTFTIILPLAQSILLNHEIIYTLRHLSELHNQYGVWETTIMKMG